MLRNSHSRPGDRAEGWLAAALLLAAFLPYLNTLGNAFVYDDIKQVLANPYIRSWRYLPEIFGSNVWSFVGAAGVTNHYRPLMTFSYLICFQLFGLVPFGYHLVNLALHAGVVLLLFRVTRQIFGNTTMAFVAALLFAVHPAHTESVAWVAGVTDLQLAFFYLLTLSLFLKLGPTAREQDATSWRPQLLLAVSYPLTLFSKEIALTLPVAAVLYEHFCRPDREATSLRQKLRRYGALWILAAAYVLFRIWLLGTFVPLPRRELPTWPEAILSGFALVAQYVAKLLWPVELCAFYVFHKSRSLAEPRVLAGAAIVAAALVCCWFLRRRNPALAFAVAWFFLTLGPVLNARWMAANVFAERYLYLPSATLCWLVGCVWARAWDDSPGRNGLRRLLAGALAAVCILQVARVVARNRDWRDDETLYTQTLRISPDAYLIRTNLGAEYFNSGNLGRAEALWNVALQQAPQDVVLLNDLGLLRARQGRFPEAEEFFRRAIALRTAYAEPHANLAALYEQMGRDDEARAEYEAALQSAPLHVGARNNFGFFLLRKEELAEAENQFHRSLDAYPSARAHAGLGLVFLRRGELGPAERELRTALQMDDVLPEANVGLVGFYERSGRWQEAFRQCEQALRLAPSNSQLANRCEELRGKLLQKPNP